MRAEFSELSSPEIVLALERLVCIHLFECGAIVEYLRYNPVAARCYSVIAERSMGPLSWYFIAGIVLCAMAIGATLIRRLPLSTSMLYLPIGWALGPLGLN